MKDRRWTHNPDMVISDMSYSAVWCTKFRRPFLTEEVQNELRKCIEERCSAISVIIDSLNIYSDHVCIDFRTVPTNCPHWVVTQLKHYTSGILREDFPDLKKKAPTLWTRAYLMYTNKVAGLNIDDFLDKQRGK